MEYGKKRFQNIYNFDTLEPANDNHGIRNRFCTMRELKEYRETIDQIDFKIAELLGDRFRIAEKVANIKKKNNIPIRIEGRIREVLDNAAKHEEQFSLPPKLGYFLWREIIEATCYHEEQILGIDTTEDI